MKLECTRDNLRRAVTATERVTGKNLPLQVLSSIIVSVGNNELSLQATNLDIGINYTIPARVENNGVCAIPGSVLLGFIQNINRDTKIQLELVGTTVSIRTDHNAAVLKTVPIDDFPQIKELSANESVATFVINSDYLCESLKAVSYASALSDIKPEIASVNIKSTGDSLVFTTTDSFRLAEKKFPHKKLKVLPKDDFSALLPIKNVNDIVRIFSEIKELVEVRIGKNQTSFISKEITLTTRLVGGVFPDLTQVFPTKSLTEVVLDKNEFTESLKMSSVFSDKFNRVQMRVVPSEGVFEISAKTGEAGENTSMLDGAISGEEVEMNFNARYILDVFNAVSGPKIGLYFSGKDRPVLMRDEEDASFSYLLMPLHS